MNKFSSDILNLQKPFASGAEHNVCLLEGESKNNCQYVYKYPDCFWNSNDALGMQENLEILSELGIQTLDTNILDPACICVNGHFISVPYVIEQEFNTQPILSEFNLSDPVICSQLKKYVELSNELYLSENKAIDFLGADAAKGLISYFFSRTESLKVFNFKLNPENEIQLMDTGLFNLEKVPSLFKSAIHFIIQIQHYLIYKVLEFNGSIFTKTPYINITNKAIAYPTFLATRIFHPFKKS
ncbi:hypothetical protein HOJ01_03245 [bacterium]|jgi:hypothetical protein|nr:hypothetical protein [bacterium]MBT6293800.1 hypothetical protein [bacterium]